jgi:hypothetical protein
VKGKEANGVGSQESCTLRGNMVYPALLPTTKTYKLASSMVSRELRKWDSSGRGINPSQRPLPTIHCSHNIQTSLPPSAADLRLTPHSHRGRLACLILTKVRNDTWPSLNFDIIRFARVPFAVEIPEPEHAVAGEFLPSLHTL